jgi:glycosyltransferase involved in cell wall biosynthesis
MVESTDLVSVVVNCHNSEKFVEDCINSIIQQNYKNFEIIVWDNNSSDRTQEIISQLAKMEKRIKFYRGEKFLTLGSARNKALLKCSGEWIAFLDSDDLWNSDFLSDQVSALKGKENEFFGFGHVTVFSNSELPLTQNENADRSISIKFNVFQSLLKGNFIYFSSIVMSRSALNYVENFNNLFAQAEDYELLLRLTQKYQALQTGHVYYRNHADNTSKKQTKELYVENIKLLRPHLSYSSAKINYAFNIAKLAIFCFKKRELSFLRIILKESKYNNFYLVFGLILLSTYKLKKFIKL